MTDIDEYAEEDIEIDRLGKAMVTVTVISLLFVGFVVVATFVPIRQFDFAQRLYRGNLHFEVVCENGSSYSVSVAYRLYQNSSDLPPFTYASFQAIALTCKQGGSTQW